MIQAPEICDLCGHIHPHHDAPHSMDGLVETIKRLRSSKMPPVGLMEGIFIRNDTSAPIGIVHVIDHHHPKAPADTDPPMKDRLDPRQSIHLFRTPGVEYVVGHPDSLCDVVSRSKTVLKDGTNRIDTKFGANVWKDFLAREPADVEEV